MARWHGCIPPVIALAVLAGLQPAAQAESLRCNGRSAGPGDSRLQVLRHCGEPALKDSFCAPVFLGSTLHPVPQPLAGFYAPCIQVDEWQYDRGPGFLSATVRFQYGRVQTITYGPAPP